VCDIGIGPYNKHINVQASAARSESTAKRLRT
jgi:hypothetical protein